MTPERFIKQFLPLALNIEKESGIFAEALLSQSALETGWGTKVKGNNYFGIKGTGQLIRTKEISNKPNMKFGNARIFKITPFIKDGKKYYEYDLELKFSHYNNPIDSFRDYARFIKDNPRYSKALLQNNAEDYLREIARAGYATGLNYEETLLNVLKSVQKRIDDITVTVAQDLHKD